VPEVIESGSGARPSGRGKPSTSYTGEAAGWNVLAEQFSALSRTLQNETDVAATLQAIVVAATDTVPGVDYASISAVRKRREVITLAATGELARAVDQAQYDTGQGPCLTSLYDQQTVRLPDMSAEPRWPAFAARAHDLGARSMLAIQLYVTGEDLGALNLHSTRTDAFTDESEQIGLLFAGHAAVAMIGAQEQEQLQTAISTRDLIGQAKGILMERYKIDAQEAFQLLVMASQTTNIKLLTVADHLASTGLLASREP
jgi:GAF domain-containing protein